MLDDQFETILNDHAANESGDSQIITTRRDVMQGSIHVVTDANFNGTTSTIALKGSNDKQNWATVYADDGTTPMSFTLGASSSNYVWGLKRVLFKFYKAVYVKGDASAGTLSANFIGK